MPRLTLLLPATAAIALLVVPPPAAGQGEAVNARLSGTITDPAGAAVPDAVIKLSSPSTGFSRQFTTTAQGTYIFTLIPPGTYEVTTEKEGFGKTTRTGIVLVVGQSSTLDVRLDVSGVTTAVDVVAAAPMLATGNVNIGSEVTTQQVVELPLNIRNVFGLVSLDSRVNNSAQNQTLNVPGTQGNMDQDITFFNFGGGRMGTTAFLLDGHWDAAGDWGGTIFVPSVDETQEFRIDTNAFSPQYGWSMGNVVNAITKSGTRSLRVGLFEFLRNDNLDANNFFNNRNGLRRPTFQRHQFGANIGAPLYIPNLYPQRDKTFFFFSFESVRQRTPTTLITTVPTLEQRRGNFSRTFNANGSPAVIYNPFTTRTEGGRIVRDPFPGNIIPQNMVDPVAVNLLRYWPEPNRAGDPLTGQNNFVGTAGLPTDGDQFTGRLDHNITQNQRIFGRMSKEYQFKQLRGEFFGSDNPGSMGTLAPNPRWNLGLGYTWTKSPTLIFGVTAGFGRWIEGRRPQGVPFAPSTLGLPAALDTFGGPGAFPSITLTGYEPLGSGVLNDTPREARSIGVDITKIAGSHTITTGFMTIDFRGNAFVTSQASFAFNRNFTQGPNPTAADPTTGDGFATLLLGTGSSGGVTFNAHPARKKQFAGWYVNDEWKIRRGLTLNLGVRYDIQFAPTERFDRFSYWSYDRNSLSERVGMNLLGGLRYVGEGGPRSLYDTDYRNIAPRLGITWSPMNRLVVRSGFGMFFIPSISLNMGVDGFSINTPYVGSLDGVTPQNLLRNPFPTGLLSPPGRSRGDQTNVGLNINAPDRSRPTPYVSQWMIGTQFEAAPHLVIEATYFGNHGVKLPFGGLQRNQLRPELLSLGSALLERVPNPFAGHITTGPLSGPTVTRGQLLRPFPHFDSVTNLQAIGGSSWYNALSLSANRRFANGLQFLVSYTWSKYLTNSEGQEGWTTGAANSVRNVYDLSLEKSFMANDIPHSFVASYIYELPVGKGRKFDPGNAVVDAIVGGWQVSGITTFKDGFPLAITAAVNNSNSLGGAQRPNLLRIPTLENPTIDRWFDTTAFAQPPAFTWGNVPRTLGYTRAHGINNFDLTVMKNWRLWAEASRLQFRTEIYNLTNRASFYAPNTNFGDPNFGRVTGTLPARSIQLGLKLYW